MRLLSILLPLVLALASTAAAAQDQFAFVTFANGKAEVALPKNVKSEEQADGTLLAHLDNTHDHTVEISAHFVDGPAMPDDAGERFVAEQAEKKGRKLRRSTGRATFMEAAVDFERNGTTYRSLHMQVGTGRMVAVLTITAPTPMSPVLEAFLRQSLNPLVNSIRRRAT